MSSRAIHASATSVPSHRTGIPPEQRQNAALSTRGPRTAVCASIAVPHMHVIDRTQLSEIRRAGMQRRHAAPMTVNPGLSSCRNWQQNCLRCRCLRGRHDRHEAAVNRAGCKHHDVRKSEREQNPHKTMRTVDHFLARRMQTLDMPRGALPWTWPPSQLEAVAGHLRLAARDIDEGQCLCRTRAGTCVTSPLTSVRRQQRINGWSA